MAYLLDTNVIAELRKARPDPHVLAWHHEHVDADVYLSVLVVGEIRQGVERIRRRDFEQAEILEHWLAGLTTTYQDRILALTTAIAQEWGRMNDARPTPVIDGLMAATARVHRLTLVTRNVSDVAGTGTDVINPFAATLPTRETPGRGG